MKANDRTERFIKTIFVAILLIAAIFFSFACEEIFLAPEEEKPVDRLTLSYEYKEVEKGVSLAEALSDLEIRDGESLLSLEEVSIVGDYDPTTRGAYDLSIEHGKRAAKISLYVEAEGVEENARFQTLDEVADEYDIAIGLPSEGDVEILVIPIGFSNRSYAGVYQTLETAFNGTEEETGWHSLKSYYEASSFGKLRLHATILPTYQTGRRWNRKEKAALDQKYLTETIAYYDERIDYSKFDANGDGFIDCVYMIYLAPYDSDTDLWWAFQDTIKPTLWTYDGVRPDNYLWMSFEFFSEPFCNFFGEEDRMGVSINAETLIHETGHALGLDDYYDYINEDEAEMTGGLGNLNMMDGTQGDHDPFSKVILGWIEPTFVYKTDYEAALSPYEESGDVLIVSKTGKNTYFQEYFIVCYYTPTGIFELKSQSDVGIFSMPGILIYHVCAAMKDDPKYLVELYQANNGTEPRLIRICEADDDDSVDGTFYAEDDDLFLAGDEFSPEWADGTPAGFTLTVVSIKETKAEISIVFED